MSGSGSAEPSPSTSPELTPSAPTAGPVSSLDARGLAKSFGAQRALKGVDLRIEAGEVVALLGENGSGKSTLVKILAGYHEPEPGGTLSLAGTPVALPLVGGDAREVGLAFVFQDLGLANELTVLENLFIGRRIQGRGPIRWRREQAEARATFASYSVDIAPGDVVGRLRPTDQALLAIVRASEQLRGFRARGGRGGILVLDEPTVFLPEEEKVFLYDLVRRVTADGTGVLFVSHDMSAVREIATRAVVLRDGVKVGDVPMAGTSNAQLVELVSGHRLGADAIARATTGAALSDPGAAAPSGSEREPEPAAGETGPAADPAGAPALTVEELAGGRLRGVSLQVRAGEIVGVAGLLGSGSEDLPYAIFGALPDTHGRVRLAAWEGDVADLDPARAQRHGLALVPADRKQQGAVAELSVATNMLSLSLPRYRRRGMLSHGRLRRDAADRCETFDVRPRDPNHLMAALSGGNQQKVVLARWLEGSPRVLLLHEPTQGVDVVTRAEIYDIMRARAREGMAILWVSTDFDELAAVAHRVLVCAGGRITTSLAPPLSRDRLTSEVYAAAGGEPAVTAGPEHRERGTSA